MNLQLRIPLAFALMLPLASGCKDTKFSGGQGPAKAPDTVQPSAASGPSTAGSGPAVPVAPAKPVGGGLINTQQSDCLLKKADKYNVTLVFDNSGSTKLTDPTNVRQQGALQLVKKFVEFVTLNPSAEVKMSTVAFAKTATRGASGLVKLSVSSEQSLVTDIVAATSDSKSGTSYKPAVEEAQRLMTEAGALAAEKRQRNYLVFLSDGKPNGKGESASNVAALFDPVVSANGVAVLSIAAGTGLGKKDEGVMQSLAKPTTGVVSPKHVGIYLRAASPTDLQQAYQQVFDTIAGCE